MTPALAALLSRDLSAHRERMYCVCPEAAWDRTIVVLVCHIRGRKRS